MDAHAYAQELLADIKAARQSRVARNDFAALNLALNRISGEWDNEKLPILTQLIELGTFEVTGFTAQGFSQIGWPTRYGCSSWQST